MSTVVNDIDQLILFLKKVKLFAELSPDSLAKLGTCLKTAEFPSAEVIVREGAPGVSMYIIKTGLVEVRKKDQTTGIDFLVTHLSEGADVGEMSLLTGKPGVFSLDVREERCRDVTFNCCRSFSRDHARERAGGMRAGAR